MGEAKHLGVRTSLFILDINFNEHFSYSFLFNQILTIYFLELTLFCFFPRMSQFCYFTAGTKFSCLGNWVTTPWSSLFLHQRTGLSLSKTATDQITFLLKFGTHAFHLETQECLHYASDSSRPWSIAPIFVFNSIFYFFQAICLFTLYWTHLLSFWPPIVAHFLSPPGVPAPRVAC